MNRPPTTLIILLCIVFLSSCNKDETTQPPINNAPSTPSNPTPADGATGVSRSPVLSWTCSDPDAGDSIRYDIYLDVITPPNVLISSDLAISHHTLSNLLINRTYYWRVIAKDSKQASSVGAVWRFTTANVTGNIAGTITDYLTDSVVQGVSIYTQPPTVTSIADAAGRYFLRNIPAGNYSIIATKNGYHESNASITVQGGDTLFANIVLGGGLRAEPSSISGGYPLYYGYARIYGGSGTYSIMSTTGLPELGVTVRFSSNVLIVSAANSGIFGLVVVKDDSTPPYTVKVPVAIR